MVIAEPGARSQTYWAKQQQPSSPAKQMWHKFAESMFLNKPPITALFGCSWETVCIQSRVLGERPYICFCIFMSHRVHRLLTALFSAPIKGWNGQKWPVCLSLFICLCWFISLCGAALFASCLLDSLPPLGIEWPQRPSSKYTPIFTWRSVCLKSLLFEGKPLRLLENSGFLGGSTADGTSFI